MLYRKADAPLLSLYVVCVQDIFQDIFDIESNLHSNYPWSFSTMKPS